MTVKNKTNKNYKRSQKGRSMVEMLGVLAIVGTLSVGGVYGYGVAMKKHKANELLHQASMLATTISAQAMSNDGKLPETITDFGNTSYGKFPTSVGETADKTGFTITISELDGSICNQLKEGGMIRNVTCDPNAKKATITYYKNLATDPAEGEKSPTGGKEKVDPCDSAKCEEGEQCIGGACVEVSACTGNCQNCVYDYATYEEICEKTIGCSKNSDCDEWCKDGEKCYCAINASSTGNDSACYNNFTGQCAVATPRSGIKGGYVVSSDYTTWWSAVNFCKAHNKSILSLADLGITGGYQDEAYCGGSECTGTVDWSDLQSKIGETEPCYWVTDTVSCDADWSCKSESNNNSCLVFYVNLSSAVVTLSDRYTNDTLFALCE